jgi:hypothetical protein
MAIRDLFRDRSRIGLFLGFSARIGGTPGTPNSGYPGPNSRVPWKWVSGAPVSRVPGRPHSRVPFPGYPESGYPGDPIPGYHFQGTRNRGTRGSPFQGTISRVPGIGVPRDPPKNRVPRNCQFSGFWGVPRGRSKFGPPGQFLTPGGGGPKIDFWGQFLTPGGGWQKIDIRSNF